MIDEEDLNPGVPADLLVSAEAAIDWAQAPADAAAWIVITVDGEAHACWFTDHGRNRVLAPSFGVAPPEGGKVIIRRPGHRWLAWAMERTRAMFWPITGMNDLLVLEPGIMDGHGRALLSVMRPNRLAARIGLALYAGKAFN